MDLMGNTHPALVMAAKLAEDYGTPLSRASRDHGPRHWRDVARIARRIAQETLSADDLTVVYLFACLHDTQREDEFHDPDHGKRAAWQIEKLPVHLSGEQEAKLVTALVHHDLGSNIGDPTVAVCWDADRLTIGRVGITPDVTYISTPHVRDHFEYWCDEATAIMESNDRTWEEIARAYRD